MKLFTTSIEKRLIKNFEINKGKEKTVDHKVVVKLFNPGGAGTWYLTEYDKDNDVAFGLCCIHDKEIGYVSMKELRDFRGTFGLKIERDKYFDSNKKTMEECRSLWVKIWCH